MADKDEDNRVAAEKKRVDQDKLNAIGNQQGVDPTMRNKYVEDAKQKLEQIKQENIALREEKNAKSAPYWTKVRNRARELSAPTTPEAYVEYGTAVMKGFALLCMLVDAASQDDTGKDAILFVLRETAGLIGNIAAPVWDATLGRELKYQNMPVNSEFISQAGTQLWDEALKKVRIRTTPLPSMTFLALNVDEKGRLQTDVMQEGISLPLEDQQFFDTGLVAWLCEKKNCQFDPATQVLKDENGLLMTNDKIRQLNQDPTTGLSAFFDEKFNLPVAERQASSSPRP